MDAVDAIDVAGEDVRPALSTSVPEETTREIRRALGVVSETEFAALTGAQISTVISWRSRGDSPAYIKVGREILYRLADIQDFLDQRAARGDRSTSTRRGRR